MILGGMVVDTTEFSLDEIETDTMPSHQPAHRISCARMGTHLGQRRYG